MKRYVIAGLAVDMEVSGRTQKQAAPYLTEADGPADITISCDVRRVLELNPQLGNEEMAEYMATGLLFSRELLAYQGLYLHASAVVLNGRAYLFSAPSGTGKSTHTKKWCRIFGAAYLNDDKPALRLCDGQWMAYGTPWSGKEDLSDPRGYPIGGIAFVKRGQTNRICRMSAEEAIPELLSQSLWRLPRAEFMEKQLSLMDLLVRQVPVWELSCRNEDAAAWVAHDAMTEENTGKETR